MIGYWPTAAVFTSPRGPCAGCYNHHRTAGTRAATAGPACATGPALRPGTAAAATPNNGARTARAGEAQPHRSGRTSAARRHRADLLAPAHHASHLRSIRRLARGQLVQGAVDHRTAL